MRPFLYCLSVLLLPSALFADRAMAKDSPTLRLGGMGFYDSAFTPGMYRFYRDFGERMGLRIEIVEAPIGRLIRDIATGQIHGMAYRTPMVEPTLRTAGLQRIPVKLANIHVGIYGKDSTPPCIATWSDLARTSGLIGLQRGYFGAIRLADSLKLGPRLMVVDSTHQAISLLKKKRIAYVIEIVELIEPHIQASAVGPRPVFRGAVDSLPVFLYLSQADTSLALRSTRVLQEMLQTVDGPRLLPDRQSRLRARHCANHLETGRLP
jgi:hypothetical protein